MSAKRGEVWSVGLDPTQGHEQAGRRPALVISADAFNASAAELVVVLPITSKPRNLPTRVEVRPPEGGLSAVSYVICEQPRTIATSRLGRRFGSVRPATLDRVAGIVRILLVL